MLQAWLQSLCTAASTNTVALRVPLYDFLETAAYYPPDDPFTTTTTTTTTAKHNSAGGATGAIATAVATPTSASDGVPYATATPYAATLPTAAQGAGAAAFAPPHLPPEAPSMAKPDPSASDGWAVPLESREASDLKLAMTGPDAMGRLTGAQAAEALRAGTGAGPEDLRAVWELSDMDRDGMLDRDEVGVALPLAACRDVLDLALVLFVVFKRVVGLHFVCDGLEVGVYLEFFFACSFCLFCRGMRRRAFLTPAAFHPVIDVSSLIAADAAVVPLSQFAVAWYLAHQAAAGNRPPSSLPSDVVPPSKRKAATRSSANPF